MFNYFHKNPFPDGAAEKIYEAAIQFEKVLRKYDSESETLTLTIKKDWMNVQCFTVVGGEKVIYGFDASEHRKEKE